MKVLFVMLAVMFGLSASACAQDTTDQVACEDAGGTWDADTITCTPAEE